jgi:predicted SnoaL-like aldol condensation-catalyzing enzyme
MTYKEIITNNLMETVYDDVPLTIAIDDGDVKIVVYHLDIDDLEEDTKAKMEIYTNKGKLTTHWRTLDDVFHAYEYALENQ